MSASQRGMRRGGSNAPVRAKKETVNMHAVTRCLVVVLLALPFSPAAFSQAQAGTIEKVAAMGWGSNVEITCALTLGQTLGELFSPVLSVPDMAKKWKANWEAKEGALGAIPQETRDNVTKALKALNDAIASDPAINWNARDLHAKKWKDLPGGSAGKAAVRKAFSDLQAGGMMMLKFVGRPEDQDADETTLD